MVTLGKQSGIAGLPEGVKETGRRVDFRPDGFTLSIETKGYRLAWSRAMYCPCKSVNDQTEQPDPNCGLCEGSGWIMFAPALPVVTKVIGALDALQKNIVTTTTSGIILGIESSITGKENPYDKVQKRLEGKKNVSVRPENRLGYHDRLINLDTTVVYSQIEKVSGPTLKSRYPIVEMNLLRSVDKIFVEHTDYSLVLGKVNWLIQPPETTDVAMHYLTYPHWRVVEHPHATRSTLVKFKSKNPKTPGGNPTDLPVQAICMLEFLL